MSNYSMLMKLFIIISFTNLLFSAEFKLISKWQHKEEILRYCEQSYLEKDNEVVGLFYKTGCRLLTAKKVIEFAPRGEGPGEVMNSMAIFPYNEDLAIVERPEKIKIFEKKEGTYVWKKTIWLRRAQFAHLVRNGLYYDNKIFFAGFQFHEKKKNTYEIALLKVYDDKGQPLKELIERSLNAMNQQYAMRYFLEPYKENVLFFAENKLAIHVVNAKELEETRVVKLTKPKFYKEMPADFYIFKKYNKPSESYDKDMETWATSYSSISNVALAGHHVVIQVRTCDPKLKKYALLFYDANNNFKLDKTIFTEDFFFGVKDNKYYCYANGNPGLDEETDDCIINIYKIGE